MSRVPEFMAQPQVLEHLGNIDYKTLKNWSRLVSPPVHGEKRQGYGNTVWYRKNDVRRLERFAEERGHQIRRQEEEEEEEGEEGKRLDAAPIQYITLAPNDGEWVSRTKEVVATELQTWQQTDPAWLKLIEENEQHRKDIQQLTDDLAQAKAHIQQLTNDLAVLRSSQIEATVLAFLSKYLPQMSELSQPVHVQKGGNAGRTQAPSTLASSSPSAHTPLSTSPLDRREQPQRSRAIDPTAPVVDDTQPLTSYADLYRRDGLVALAQFEDLHHIRHQNVIYHIREGWLTTHTIHWNKKSRKPLYKQGIDPEGEAQFYKNCHKLSGFTRCDRCPHGYEGEA